MTMNKNIFLLTDSISTFVRCRIVFFGSNAQILPQVNNPKQPKYLYYYEKAADVAKSMKNALRLNINAIKANVA